MEKKFVKVSQLKENGYVLIDDIVCRITSIDKSKPGKHGSTKARIVATGIFQNTKKGLLQPTSADAEVPIIEKGAAQVVAVMGNVLQLMDTTTYETFNADAPSDLKDLKSGDEIEVMRYGENAKVLRKKPTE
ncbi:translation initiation factor IF-5A [Candidatus Micrarchaeota archaeon]|nr:translation initiation factor IF-5A [Candidatus Micrarchaeota archaeon]MBU2476357.1 translation initiation factor IF-5A [Candidatus Micrarchaeota archaeon]